MYATALVCARKRKLSVAARTKDRVAWPLSPLSVDVMQRPRWRLRVSPTDSIGLYYIIII